MILRVSATDVDEGRNQDISYTLEATRFPQDLDYFRWDEKTGEIWLKKKLDKPQSSVFQLKAIARDNGSPQSKESRIDVTIEVKESSNKPPVFRQGFLLRTEIKSGYYLVTKVVFDREEQMEYQIPVRVEDNKGKAATSWLKLVVAVADVKEVKEDPSEASTVFVCLLVGLSIIILSLVTVTVVLIVRRKYCGFGDIERPTDADPDIEAISLM